MKLPTPNIHEESFAYYTEAQMRQAIKDALEEAAKVCDPNNWPDSSTAALITLAIRKLKEDV